MPIPIADPLRENISLGINEKNLFKEFKMNNAPNCRCGRSPTGNCMGWHVL